MSYCILGRCARTGRLGIAAASYSMAIGQFCEGAVRPSMGATFTAGNPRPQNNRLALNLLEQGWRPEAVVDALVENDPHEAWRHIGIIDQDGAVAVHTGTRLRAAAQRSGTDCATFGEDLAAAGMLEAMAGAFAAAPMEDLDLRLLAALEAGRDAGGLVGRRGRLPERSAAVVVWHLRAFNEIDLRVDLHDHAVEELRRIHDDCKPTLAYYDERGRNPQNAESPIVFAQRLRQQQGRTPS
jgi:uncharacterized Ntn-hydrolase superfamily protein